jgi:hypothetical protein
MLFKTIGSRFSVELRYEFAKRAASTFLNRQNLTPNIIHVFTLVHASTFRMLLCYFSLHHSFEKRTAEVHEGAATRRKLWNLSVTSHVAEAALLNYHYPAPYSSTFFSLISHSLHLPLLVNHQNRHRLHDMINVNQPASFLSYVIQSLRAQANSPIRNFGGSDYTRAPRLA